MYDLFRPHKKAKKNRSQKAKKMIKWNEVGQTLKCIHVDWDEPSVLTKRGGDGKSLWSIMAPFSFLQCFDEKFLFFFKYVLRGFHGLKLMENG